MKQKLQKWCFKNWLRGWQPDCSQPRRDQLQIKFKTLKTTTDQTRKNRNNSYLIRRRLKNHVGLQMQNKRKQQSERSLKIVFLCISLYNSIPWFCYIEQNTYSLKNFFCWFKLHYSLSRLRAVPIFSLEFVEPRKDIAKTGARKSLLLFFLAQDSARRFSRCLSAARRTQEEK